MKTKISLRLDSDINSQIRQIAMQEDSDIIEIVEEALKDYINHSEYFYGIYGDSGNYDHGGVNLKRYMEDMGTPAYSEHF